MRLDGPGKNSYPTDGVVKGIMDFPEIWYISITTLAASFCQISSFSPPRNKSYKPPHLKAVIIVKSIEKKKSEKFPLPPTHLTTPRAWGGRCRFMWLDEPGKNSYPTDGVVKGIMDFPEIWYTSITTLAASFCQISRFSPPWNQSYKAFKLARLPPRALEAANRRRIGMPIPKTAIVIRSIGKKSEK